MTESKPFEILLDRQTIARRTAEMGRAISADYRDKNPVLLGVLKGCIMFLADLMREVSIPVELEFVTAASYCKGTVQANEVVIGGGLEADLRGRHILLVEGVVDSGRTVARIREHLSSEEPASVEVVTLIDKPGSHRVDLAIKYFGFSLGNEFVIGYGLDNTQQYRNLPYIGRMPER